MWQVFWLIPVFEAFPFSSSVLSLQYSVLFTVYCLLRTVYWKQWQWYFKYVWIGFTAAGTAPELFVSDKRTGFPFGSFPAQETITKCAAKLRKGFRTASRV